MASTVARLPPGFVMLDEERQQQQVPSNVAPQLPPGFKMVPEANQTVTQELSATEAQPRAGDFLKPYFGGHNPIAETYDTFIEPLTEVSSDRPIVDRVLDTVSFAGSVPFQALRLPTPGQLGEEYLGDSSLREREENFVENNPKLIRAMGAAGEIAPGITPGLGQGATGIGAPVRAGARQARESVQYRPAIQRQIAEDTQRARQAAQNMRDLDINPYGPAVAMARRGDNSPGRITQFVADKPIAGGPVQRGARQFVEETEAAFNRTRREFGPEADINTAGQQLKHAVDTNRTSRNYDFQSMPDDALEQVAKAPVRTHGYRNVQSAKYERANRLMDGWVGRKPVGKGNAKDAAGLTNTVGVLLDIKNRYGRTINKTAQATGRGGALRKGDLDFNNPNWTNSRSLNQSFDVIASDPQWRAGLQGIRDIRSEVRRARAGSKGDNEVRALQDADLARLEKALTRDMYDLFRKAISKEWQGGNPQQARRLRSAFDAMREADQFTRRYEKDVFTPLKRILHDGITPENAAGEILKSMYDGTRGNLDRLRALRRVLPREELDNFASAALREMGRPNKGAPGGAHESGIQIAKLVSEWRDMNPTARRLVFGSNKQRYQQLEKLINVAENMKDLGRLANHSNTGVSNAMLAVSAAGGSSLATLNLAAMATIIGGVAGWWGAGKYLASPAYVAWLERSARLGSSSKQQRIGHIRRLGQLVARDKAMPPEVAQPLMIAINRALTEEQQ